jgi:hypothetical protein
MQRCLTVAEFKATPQSATDRTIHNGVEHIKEFVGSESEKFKKPPYFLRGSLEIERMGTEGGARLCADCFLSAIPVIRQRVILNSERPYQEMRGVFKIYAFGDFKTDRIQENSDPYSVENIFWNHPETAVPNQRDQRSQRGAMVLKTGLQ